MGVMTMKIVLGFKKLIHKLSLSLKRFPISLVYAALTVLVVIMMNHTDVDVDETYTRIAMTLALGIPLSLSIYMYFEGRKNIKKHVQLLFHGIIGVLLLLYYLFFLKDLEMVASTRYVAYTISSYLLFSFIPYLHRKENYELYVIKLFNRFIITYVYSVILYLGLAAILGTINLLFNINISWKLYFDIAVIVAGIFAPAFFLSDVPKRDEELLVDDYPKVLGVLLQYIILPLISVYTIILYIYFGKCIITTELPRGIIGNLVLWYSIVSAIILFFIYPLRNNNQWVKTFIGIFPKVIIPLLIMMFMAIGIRINTYGITESRYFVLIVGLWVTGVMIYYAIKKKINNIMITITLAIIGFLAVTGPWSAYSISQLSQNNRFEKILIRYDMIGEASQIIKPKKELEEIDKKEISGIITYFHRYHDIRNIKYLSEEFQVEDMENIFGFDLKEDDTFISRNREYFSHYVDHVNRLVRITDYDYFVDYASYRWDNQEQIDGEFLVLYDGDQKIEIKQGEKVIYGKDIKEVAANIHRKNRGQHNPPETEMTFIDENQKVKIYIVFKSISGFENTIIDEVHIDNIEYYLFIKVK